MAGVTEKVLPHLESMEPAEILDSARNLERFDYVARRNYGLEHQPRRLPGQFRISDESQRDPDHRA